ncbi:Phytoene dehydrogenase [Chitinispirillum alkaliphilum]|nr:Phytoene dehydrogenase [Chitinispirillum alkaliphilum]
MSNKYDVIVIGSGIGGLTSGAFLANSGKKVLVLEQHYQIGGYTHSFKRRGFNFESAVHSVPMSPHGLIFHLLNQLGIGEKIKTIPHNSMYRSIWPDFSYTLPPYCDDIIRALGSDFPKEKTNIRNVFDSMRSFYESLIDPVKKGSLDETTSYREFINTFQNRSYKEYLDSFLTDDRVRRVFYSQWPFGGTPPSGAPVAYYVLMFMVHAMEGSHYLEGGFSKLADALASVITDNGGAVLTRKKVTGIHVENGLAKRVTTSKNEEYFADLIISNISPYSLHSELIDSHARNKLWLRRLGNLTPSLSSVILYLGLTEDIDDFTKENITFWYAHNDDEAIYSSAKSANCRDEPDHLILLRPAHHVGGPTLTLMNFVRNSCSDNWKTDKHLFAQKMLDKAESIYPGLSKRVSMKETGSPDTFFRYTSNTDGSLYGFENTKSIYGEAKLPSKTHIKNIYQSGHWGKPGGGIWNAVYNGYSTYLMIKGEQKL